MQDVRNHTRKPLSSLRVQSLCVVFHALVLLGQLPITPSYAQGLDSAKRSEILDSAYAYTGLAILDKAGSGRDSVLIDTVTLQNVQTPYVRGFLDGTRCVRLTYRMDDLKLDSNYAGSPRKRPKIVELYLSLSDYHFLLGRLIKRDGLLPVEREVKVASSGEEDIARMTEVYTGLAIGVPTVTLWKAFHKCRGGRELAAREIEVAYVMYKKWDFEPVRAWSFLGIDIPTSEEEKYLNCMRSVVDAESGRGYGSSNAPRCEPIDK